MASLKSLVTSGTAASSPSALFAKDFQTLASNLLRRNFTGSAACMRAVAQFFQSLLSKANALTSPTDPLSISAVRSLVVEIVDVLTQAAGTVFIANNVCARVLKLIDEAPLPEGASDTSKISFASIEESVLDAVNELVDELETADTSIAEHISSLLESDEVIITVGNSTTVNNFLVAAKKFKPSVYVAERSPDLDGHKAAIHLQSKLSSPVLLLADAAVGAVIKRASKVIIGAQAVCADGTVIAKSGTLPVVMAAHAACVPVLVVCNALKFIPTSVKTEHVIAKAEAATGLPQDILPESLADDVETIVPAYDVLRPEWIAAIITNTLLVGPSEAHRIIEEMY